MMSDDLADETRKYLRVWRRNDYRDQCDGLPVVGYACHIMNCSPGDTLIDWGCGTGKASKAFAGLGLQVTGFDIASNCLDSDVKVPLVVGTIWDPPSELAAQYGFCTDVLEHLPEDKVGLALEAIRQRTERAAYIQVDTAADIFGAKMEPPVRLHLTVQPAEWWHEMVASRWPIIKPCAGSYSRAGFLCLA